MVENINVSQHLPEDLDQIMEENGFASQLHQLSSADLKYIDMLSIDTSHLERPPTLEEIEEPQYKFEVNLPGDHSGKNTWVYSSELKKVYIKMNKTFIVNVSFNNEQLFNSTYKSLFLRIVPVFLAPEDNHLMVNRCLNHQSSQNESENDHLKYHIAVCKQPSNAQYEGKFDAINYGDRLSIKIPMANTQCRVEETIGLEFLCQNSCTSGINRRCTAMIFALETSDRIIIGKRLLQFKICSCPKRDKEKEEQQIRDANSKRKAEGNLCQSQKKILKAVIKKEFPIHDTKNVSVNYVLPDQKRAEFVQQAVINAIGCFISENPDNQADWLTYKTSLEQHKFG